MGALKLGEDWVEGAVIEGAVGARGGLEGRLRLDLLRRLLNTLGALGRVAVG